MKNVYVYYRLTLNLLLYVNDMQNKNIYDWQNVVVLTFICFIEF